MSSGQISLRLPLEGIVFDRISGNARHWIRAKACRYDKTARNFLAAVYLAASAIWLN